MERIASRFEAVGTAIGKTVNWLTLAMVLVTFLIVLLRYWLDLGWIWLQESVVWMHAAVFMLAASRTLAEDGHVRVDIFYRNMSARRRAQIDAAGTVLFLFPVAAFLIWSSFDYVLASWSIREGSREAGGLAYPAPSMMKTLIPLTSVLLLLQGSALLLRALARIRATGH